MTGRSDDDFACPFAEWNLGGNIMVQGYVDDDGRSIVWYPGGSILDEDTLCIFREDDAAGGAPMLAVPCAALQAARDILSNDPAATDEGGARRAPQMAEPTIPTIRDTLDGLEDAIDGLTSLTSLKGLTCGEAADAVARIEPTKRLISEIASVLNDCASTIEDLYDYACPNPGAEDLVNRIDAILTTTSDNQEV